MSRCARLMFLLLIFLSVSRALCARKDGVYGDGVSSPSGCQNCSICQYPCRPQPPPPTDEGYPSAGTPPPPSAQGNCPPVSAGCCQYPQYNPPSPPNPYTYVPYNNFSASPAKLVCTESRVSILFTFLLLPAFVSSLNVV